MLSLAAAAFWSGILWATASRQVIDVRTGTAFLIAGTLVLATAALAGSRSRSPAGSIVRFLAVYLSFGLLGAGWGGIRDDRVRSSPVAALAGRSVRGIGAIAASPERGMFGWTGAMWTEVVLTKVGRPAAIRAKSLVWLEGAGLPPKLSWGERVEVEGAVKPLKGSFGSYLRRRGYSATLEVDGIRDIGPPPNVFRRLANSVRRSLRRSVSRMLPVRQAGLLMGLALGDTSSLDPSVEEDFRATGLSHLTAASGANVAMFLAPILGLAGLAGAGRRARLTIGIGAIGFFVLLTGAEPSVLRAVVMSGLTLLGVFLGRPRSPPAILGGAVLLLLTHDPTLVHAVGFQLSVAATVGIALLAHPLAGRLSRLPGPIALAAATTLAAQAGVLPLLLFYFRVFPLVSIPANLLAFPAVGPGMLLGLAAGALEMVWRPMGFLVGAFARLPLGYLGWLSDRLARSPLPSVTSTGGQLETLLVGLTLLGLAGWWIRSGRQVSRRAVLLGALVLPLIVLTGAFRAGPPSRLSIVFFDVAQGDAALVRSPGGATILIDGGPDPDLVAAKLAALGVRRLDLMVATHPHADHVGGLPSVLARFAVGLVIDPGCGGDSPYYSDFLRAVRSAGVRFGHPVAGTVLRVGDVRLEVLSPERCYHGTESDPNNDSIVLRITRRSASAMFGGDAEQPAQSEMLDDPAFTLTAQVLKVPHHGGDTSLRQFFRAVHATVAVVSVGPNRYGHPVPALLRMLAQDGMRVFRTDRAGDITVSFDEGRILVTSGR